MSCYGLPSTLLNIKEYGGSTTFSGPVKDIDFADFYKTFSYEKSGQALHGDSGTEGATDGFFIRTAWSSSIADDHFTNAQQLKKSVEFRIKPVRSNENYHLFSLSGSNNTGASNINLAGRDHHLLLCPHTGSDISSSGDSTQYGALHLYQGPTFICSSSNFPVYNDAFWNVFLRANKDPDSNDAQVTFGALQSNFNKNVSSYITSSHTSFYKFAWGSEKRGAKYAFFGGIPTNDNAIHPGEPLRYSGSLQGINIFFGELISDATLKKHALEPYMYSGNSPSSSFENLVLRLPLGANDYESSASFHPNVDLDILNGLDNGKTPVTTEDAYNADNLFRVTSSMASQRWEEVVEPHFLPTPDTVGASMTSDKVRIDTGTIPGNILVSNKKLETSTLDRQPPEYEDLGIFFSPTEEINEDIIYTLGSFRMDDYIGSPLPSAQSSSIYEDLSDIKDVYVKKVKNRYNYWDYIKQIQYIDHTLFKMIEQFVPARANLKTGLVIEPHFLERNKFKRTLPVRSDAQTMTEGLHQTFEGNVNGKIYTIRSSSATDFGQKGLGGATNIEGQHDPGSYLIYYDNFIRENSGSLNSNGRRKEQGTNATIGIYDDYINPANIDSNRENQQACQAPIKPFVTTKPEGYKAHESSVLLGNMIGGKKSNKYYKYAEYNMTTSSLYINQP